ncbi:L,D-transpeptidase family protein [Oceanomicrobium pacificus]|uniref:L,D-transpeptidase family protein n=1 Tax=Oceanomicrobium pacificus TaxID=2692916 RepID=A0A6B0TWY7_9RHOB|nr:L,D-transpeptidase family protein [Oceanomicrobium pacificus]MXU66245.1 L,D-transpeptidase family protein [Oceanomicrobium pacificus]
MSRVLTSVFLASSIVFSGLTATTVPAVAQSSSQLALNAEQAALYAEIRKTGKLAEDLMGFYQARGFKPVWVGQRAASRALVATLADADSHALPLARYNAGQVQKELNAARGTTARAAAEIRATQMFLQYAHDISSGLVEPRRIDSEMSVPRPRRSDAALLNGLNKHRNTAGYLAALAPATANYKGLLAEKVRLEKLIARGGWGPEVGDGPSLKPGMSSPRIPALRARLTRMGYGRLGTAPGYDARLQAAVQKFQTDHGLNADAVVGGRTLAAINTSPQDRLVQVAVNLERERWLNLNRGARHIHVNLADFTVKVIDKGRTTFESRVVAGQTPKFRTQEFNDTMTHMVINPTWHVPASIATEELLPAIQEDPTYLQRKNMRVVTRDGGAVNPASVDFNAYSQENFPYLIKQAPNGGNALGRVKFMFPNRYNIYLHDTPSKSLFARDARAFSHGCVRVQKPFELAEVLLARQVNNPKGTFNAILETGRERTVSLAQPVPIYLSYNSAFIDEKGKPQYRADIYGRDRKVYNALRKAGVSIAGIAG